MDQLKAVTAEAVRLYDKDDDALLVSIGKRDIAVKKNPATQIEGDPGYASTEMSLDDVKAAGRRVLRRWNKELYKIICPSAGASDKERDELMKALNISEVAAIGIVTGLLLPLGVPAPVAAPLAALIVKKFLMPAKEELCGAWGEAIASEE